LCLRPEVAAGTYIYSGKVGRLKKGKCNSGDGAGEFFDPEKHLSYTAKSYKMARSREPSTNPPAFKDRTDVGIEEEDATLHGMRPHHAQAADNGREKREKTSVMMSS